MDDIRLQTRVVYLGRSATSIEQFRVAHGNGWGARRWRSTPYLAWTEYRKALKYGA